MHKPDPVETILARLMPPALSEAGQRDIAAMLDELEMAGAPTPQPVPARPVSPVVRFRRPLIGGLAAAVAAAAVAWPLVFPPSPAPAATTSTEDHAPEMVLVSESGSIRSMSDDGWREDADGSAMRALHLSVVEENKLFDEETGIVMLVSEPREELLLMPVSTF